MSNYIRNNAAIELTAVYLLLLVNLPFIAEGLNLLTEHNHEFDKKYHVVLLPHTGAYSHDMVMKRVGEELSGSGDVNITFAQVRVFDLKRAIPQLRGEWTPIIYNYEDERIAMAGFTKRTEPKMWTYFIPFDIRQMTDTHGGSILFKIHQFHMRACEKALNSDFFLRDLLRKEADLVVMDFILNECAVALSAKLNASTIYLFNGVIVHSYAAFLNIPTNPATVPHIFSVSSPHMDFLHRFTNTICYVVALWTREIFSQSAETTFKKAGELMSGSIERTVEKGLLYATQFEFLLDTPRPQTQQLKYLGCAHCFKTPKKHTKPTYNSIQEIMNMTQYDVINPNGVILVTFGSLVHGEYIPEEVVGSLLGAFSMLNYTVIWQFGSSPTTMKATLPPNVLLVEWLPLLQLLQNPQTKLIIGHGGVGTSLESVLHGVPLLGIPLQGDTAYCMGRIVDKGVGELLELHAISTHALYDKITHILDNRDRYAKNIEKLHLQLEDYQNLFGRKNTSLSLFWYQWSLKHGNYLRRTKHFFRFKYHNYWTYYNLDVILFFSTIPTLFIVFCVFSMQLELTAFFDWKFK